MNTVHAYIYDVIVNFNIAKEESSSEELEEDEELENEEAFGDTESGIVGMYGRT